MSLLFDNQADGELKKFSDYMVSHVYNQNNYQQTTHNQSLSRYRSAPSSFLTSLVDVNGGFNDRINNVGNENYRNNRSSSPEIEAVLPTEIETLFPRLVSSTNGSDNARSRFGDMPVKEEAQNQSLYHNESSSIFHNQEAQVSRDNSSFSVPNSLGLEQRPIQFKAATRSCSNLARQSSSPAGFFSEMNIENGFDLVRHVGSFRSNFNSTNGNVNLPSSTAMNASHLNFLSSSSSLRHMPEVAEEVNENMDGSRSQGDRISLNAKICDKIYNNNFPENPWDSSLLRNLKRGKDENGNALSTSNIFDIRNEDFRNHAQHLTHHLSLPANFNEISTREKILQFQDFVPFKVRARRGCATHPRSIAERVRRTRISERMKKLQDLFPITDKQTSTAEMLDLAVERIKDLQKQAKTLSETRAKCRCLR